jgi:hypothetical protein
VLARGHQSGAVFTIVAAAKQSGVVTFTSVNVIKFVLINIVRTSPISILPLLLLIEPRSNARPAAASSTWTA